MALSLRGARSFPKCPLLARSAWAIAGSPERGGWWPRMEGFPFLQSSIYNPTRRVLKFTTLLCKAKENASDASTSGWWCSRITQMSNFDRPKPQDFLLHIALVGGESHKAREGVPASKVCVRTFSLSAHPQTPLPPHS